MSVVLPEVKRSALYPEYFPTAMQAFIFRNWGMVPCERLAQVLRTDCAHVEEEAFRMGLKPQCDVSQWAQKGYITIIRANWHLLDYDQLLELLDWDAEKLSLVLKEEDFLDVKMGLFKPASQKIHYRPLTEEELEKTERIRAVVAHSIGDYVHPPFDFFRKEEVTFTEHAQPAPGQVILDNDWYIQNETGDAVVDRMAARFAANVRDRWQIDLLGSGIRPLRITLVPAQEEEYHVIHILEDSIVISAGGSASVLRALYRIEDLLSASGGPFLTPARYERVPRFGVRMLYSFCGLYQNALEVDSRTYCPDSLLDMYARTGVNGIWIQAVLYLVTEFPFAPEISTGWQQRLSRLKDLVDRAREYGIRIFLYMNEPRSMPLSFFEKYPHLKGTEMKGYASMCTATQEVRSYLADAVETLCRAVPNLGGFFTITMSENLTNCKSKGFQEHMCPRCADRESWEMAAEVNAAMAARVKAVAPSMEFFVWDWGWESSWGFTEEGVRQCISALPDNVSILCRREANVPFTRGGVSGQVRDYSISVGGLSENSLRNWRIAAETGHGCAVKLQMNNTWECSTVPYLPVFRTLTNLMDLLGDAGINHLMLSWTLGGYPSPNIKIISEAFFEENGQKPDYDRVLSMTFGADTRKIRAATDIFCEAFAEFPFDIGVLYKGPQNSGVSNPFYIEPTGYNATMTCYPYDDLEHWRSIYPAGILEDQYRKVAEKWQEGLALLDGMEGELADMAYVSWSLFASSWHQVKYVRLRDRFRDTGDKVLASEICDVVRREAEITEAIYRIMLRRPEIGYEAANHYYFSTDMVLEKLVNCAHVLNHFTALAQD